MYPVLFYSNTTASYPTYGQSLSVKFYSVREFFQKQ